MMLELYHNDISTCSQKVRLALAEKGLHWTSHHMDLRAGDAVRPAYLQLNPQGVVPTLVVDGSAIAESTIINEFIDDIAVEPALKPDSPFERSRMRLWTLLLDTEVHAMTGVLTFAMYIRYQMADRSDAEMESYFRRIPDPQRRERQQEIFRNGTDSPLFTKAVRRFSTLLDDMESALSSGPWLSGGAFSLADIGLAPYMYRLEMLQMSALWSEGRRTLLRDWWARTTARPSFQEAVVKWIPSKSRDLMASKGRENRRAVESILDSCH